MRITVTNFQSIQKAEIECSGFTVIVGKSNLGKSALFRALRAAFLGWRGDHFVRLGANHCGVAIEDTDFKLIWRKVIKESPQQMTALQIDKDIHTKLGPGGHAKATKKLGIYELEVGARCLTPQFARQDDPIFLVSETDTTVAEVFRTIGRADTITTAQAMAKKELKEKETEKEIRYRDHSAAEVEVQRLAAIPSLRKRFDETKTAVESEQKAILEANCLLDRIIRLRTLTPTQIPDDTLAQTIRAPKAETILPKVQRLSLLGAKVVPQEPKIENWTGWNTLRLINASTIQHTSLTSTSEALARSANEIRELGTSVAELERLLGVCPTCNRAFGDHPSHAD